MISRISLIFFLIWAPELPILLSLHPIRKNRLDPVDSRVGNGSGKVRVEQIPARDNTRNYKAYPYSRNLAGKILDPYPYPSSMGRVSGTHRVF